MDTSISGGTDGYGFRTQAGGTYGVHRHRPEEGGVAARRSGTAALSRP